MAGRLNKRQQRELEELQTLGGPGLQADASESEEETQIRAPKAAAFAALMGDAGDDASEDEDDEPKSKSRKTKKKKKKSATTVTAAVANTTPKPSPQPSKPIPSTSAKSEKKALKKAKAKERKAQDDELEEALKELQIKYPPSQKINQKTASGQTFADLLSVAPQHLDPDAEMRKFFGSKVVQANKTPSAAGSSSKRQTATARSVLTRPQSTWWSAKQREGLSIRQLSDEEVQLKLKTHRWEPVLEERWWTVEYSKRYRALTKVFMRTVASGDPQGFYDLLSRSPWHADTLLQLSEVYRHREEYAQAVDFVDRAMFTYERAFIGAFNFTSGNNRLDFDHVENRPFFLAIHRQVADLQRRGCVRTAFEFSKLLYSLDPWNDPHGALLHLDYLATKTGLHQWIVDLFDLFSGRRQESQKTKPDSRINPSFLPGFTYARSLALRLIEVSEKSQDHSRSNEALRDALRDFPSVLPLLADKLDIALPASIRSHPDFKVQTDGQSLGAAMGALHLQSHLYVQRSFALWKDHSDWLSNTAIEVFEKLPSRLPATQRQQDFLALYENQGPRYSAYRHLVILESTHRNLFPFIPQSVQHDSRSLSCDPLPPLTSISRYDDEFFKGMDDLQSFRTRTRRERAMDERRLAQMVPDAGFRQQLEGFFNGNPGLHGRFPGGIVQFAQAVAQLPPDVLEDIMIANVGAEQGGEQVMPGGLVDILDMNGDGPVNVPVRDLEPQLDAGNQFDDEELEGEGDFDEEEEEEDISPIPTVIRNILGRFWGRAPPEDNDSSDEETELLDNTGVD
ncbi:DUF654-domain-containing protein [Coprinopsis marcescibilis]|uniref:DUF654-domain-containing protein n=1 Tax=Coprinopsis marcescibilis TaxID=230819 RepID=A0A5C3KQG0_COPMA|nr:DUF654-domain-containing protein [Coprinopsis marcescibilis]